MQPFQNSLCSTGCGQLRSSTWHSLLAAVQVVGECARDSDLEVNPVREKKLTNIRTVSADEKVGAPTAICGAPKLLA